MSNRVLDYIIAERIRPTELKEVILLDRIRKIIGKGNVSQHLLFYSSPGSGKTTLAKVLASDTHSLYINVSNDRGIDTVRSSIRDFCSTHALAIDDKNYNLKKKKIVILDEFDGATMDFFKAMRATMDEFNEIAIFVATCNYINKIPTPMQSRFLVVPFEPINKIEEAELIELYMEHIQSICTDLKTIKFENEDVLRSFVKRKCPDLRFLINQLQQFYDSKVKVITSDLITKTSFAYEDFFKLITKKGNEIKNYTYVMSNFQGKEDDIISYLKDELPNYIKENLPDKKAEIPNLLIKIAEWDYKKNMMIDKILAILAMTYECQMILNRS